MSCEACAYFMNLSALGMWILNQMNKGEIMLICVLTDWGKISYNVKNIWNYYSLFSR